MVKELITATCMLITLAGCVQNSKQDSGTKKTEYRKISTEEAKKMLDANPDVTLLDVRTEPEFRERRIPGAVLLPSNEIKSKAAEALPDKDALILIYCRSGVRSASAARTLISMGYTNVYDFGGIMSWHYQTEKN